MYLLQTLLLTLALFAPSVFAQYKLIESLNDNLFPFSAQFNGSTTVIEHTTQPQNAECNDKPRVDEGYTLSIGPQDVKTYRGQNYSRGDWDPNPFWFRLAGYQATPDARRPAVRMKLQSTDGGTYSNGSYGVYIGWTIHSSTPVDDGVDFEATYMPPYEDNKLINEYSHRSCITNHILQNIGIYNWTMKGHISPKKVKLEFGPRDWVASGWQLQEKWSFEGTWNEESAKLSFDKEGKAHTEGVIEGWAKDAGAGSLRTSAVIVWGSLIIGVVMVML